MKCRYFKRRTAIFLCSFFVIVAVVLNHKYEIIAFHPFFGSDYGNLKVMTWNVHCPDGADSVRQQRIAELILQEDADFVLLNEFNQDSCLVLDSMLRTKYAFTEEYQSHQKCGDIFYSKRKMSRSGRTRIFDIKYFFEAGLESYPDSLRGRSIQAIKATVSVGCDSVQFFGMHLLSNSGDGSMIVNGLDSLKKIDSFYHRYKTVRIKRSEQVHWIKEVIMESKHPVIAMGDMNDFNCSAPLDSFVSAGLTDAWWEGGNGYGCTFHSGWMLLRIDHIMHSDVLELTGVKVIPTDLSDHNPVVASFKIIRK